MFEILKLIFNFISLVFEIIKFIYNEHIVEKAKNYYSNKRKHKEKK